MKSACENKRQEKNQLGKAAVFLRIAFEAFKELQNPIISCLLSIYIILLILLLVKGMEEKPSEADEGSLEKMK